MKILLVFRVQKGFDFQSKVVFGGMEKFAKQIYDLFPNEVEICQITKFDRQRKSTAEKIESAISDFSPDLAIINDPAHSFFKPFIELGVPLISIIHEPMVRDFRFLDLGARLNSYMDSGVHIYFVSELQHQFHSKMSRQINDVNIQKPTGFIHSSYISSDFVVSKEHEYDVGSIGRMDQLKNPFFVHKKSEGTGLKSLVMSSLVDPNDFKTGHAVTDYQNKNLDWKTPQTTMLGLPHNEVLRNISKCKSFVSTWADESWGITTLEALGSGVPAMLVTNTPTDYNMGNNHASEIIPASKDHYVKIPKKISNEEFQDIAIKLGNISYDKRIEIAEMTREKHSEENYKKTWERMFNVLLDENRNRNLSQEETVSDIMIFDKVDYSIRGDNQITLSKELEAEIKSRFKKDRENRFQIFLLSSSLRNKYLDKETNSYIPEFQKWYKKTKMDELFGQLGSNFSKYASCGDVVSYVGTQTRDPEKYLKQLPLSVGALYEISTVLKDDTKLFDMLLHYTPKRKNTDEPKHEWKTPRPALISKNSSEVKIRSWKQKWASPPQPKPKRTDKRTLPLLSIAVNGELFDFNKKTGDKTGCVDLHEVEEFLSKVKELINEQNEKKFKIEDNLGHLTDGYFKRKDQYDPTAKIKDGRKDPSEKYV